jgi:hypothetical protein
VIHSIRAATGSQCDADDRDDQAVTTEKEPDESRNRSDEEGEEVEATMTAP